jgi:pre-mRNA-splicing factor CWC22
MSALDFEEAGHKLMKIQVDPGREIEVVTMILECCSQEKTYIRCAMPGQHPSRFCVSLKVSIVIPTKLRGGCCANIGAARP